MKSLLSTSCLLLLFLISSCKEEDTFTGSASIIFKANAYQDVDSKLHVFLYFNETDSEPFKDWREINLRSGRDNTLDVGKLNYGNYYIRYYVQGSDYSSYDRSQPFQVIAGEHKSVEITLRSLLSAFPE